LPADREALVLGATGAMGAAIADALAEAGARVTRTSRSGADGTLTIDPIARPETLATLAELPRLDAVVWAQGTNVNDTVADVHVSAFEEVMAGNVTFVVATLQHLLSSGRIADGARAVVVSSIWERLARPGKFSYTVSKAAIGGLVRAASVDLAERGVLVNAVLPSVTDTPMSRAMLGPEKVKAVAGQTGFGRLTSLEDVTGLVVHLCSPQNTGVTGQSITVDLGFSLARAI